VFSSAHPLVQAAIAETESLHAFFESWFGPSPPPPDAFARVEVALAPSFKVIGPDGLRETRAAVIAFLHAERGARGPAFRIRVEAAEPLALEPPVVVLTYRERQWRDGAESLRQSTAVFRAEPAAPHRVAWLTLHETWLPLYAPP